MAQTLRLALTLYSLIGTTLAGSAVVAALVSGYGDAAGIAWAAAAGFALGAPVSLLVAAKLVDA